MINEEDNEVERLTRELQSLSLRTLEISRRLNELTNNNNSDNSEIDNTLRIGDTVRVTANYRNRRGTIGTITRTTAASVWIRPHNTNLASNQNIRLRIGSVERVLRVERSPERNHTSSPNTNQDVVQYEQ